jgi:Divergent InlB B-repeat domain/FG-GAP repeat
MLRPGLGSLPVAARGPVSEALGADLPGYQVTGLRAVNPAQQLSLRFSAPGAHVGSGQTDVTLGLIGVGRPGADHLVARVRPRVVGNRVVYAHRGVSEWYVNGPSGLEQGFVVGSRPVGDGPLVLSVALRGNGGARLVHGQVLLGGLRYGGLVVTDAAGHAVRSWFELARGRVLIEIADRGAVFPLWVDPFVQQGAKLTGSGEVGNAQFGISVALSADGNTALIGGPDDSSAPAVGGGFGPGAAWVFTRLGSTWTQQGTKLTPSDEIGDGGFGSAVALSSDGNTALIGGSGDGAAWVFTRSGSTWTQQGTKLTGTGNFGSSVALSSDGNTALIGGPNDNGVGAAWVFTRSGSTWTLQGSKLTGSGEVGDTGFGSSVALSSDGDTALIGGPGDNPDTGGSGAGAAWVFTRSGSGWTQQGNKLTGGRETGNAFFGESVALSSDGNTALIGGSGDNSDAGAAWVFTRSGSTWTQDGNKLTGSGEVGNNAEFGASVALSSNGNTALIGGPNDQSHGDFGAGAAWVFTRVGSTWTQQGSDLKAVDDPSATIGYLGWSVALSSNGNTALIGDPADTRAIDAPGAARVFVPGHALTVGKAGTGSGTVTSSPKGISCTPKCSAPYAVGTHVTLSAKPAAGSLFSGWSGDGCSGKGSCTVTLSSDRSVTAKFTLEPPKITRANIDRKHHTATFRFTARGAPRFECALIRANKQHKKSSKPRLLSCRSPATYKHLKKGAYTFEVHTLSHGGAGPATQRQFSI